MARVAVPRQLAFALDHAESFARDDFLSGPSNDDALLRAVLVKLFADRQLGVDEQLVGYVANHIERSFAAARVAVAELDAEAMRRKRPLTRALAAETLRQGRLDL